LEIRQRTRILKKTSLSKWTTDHPKHRNESVFIALDWGYDRGFDKSAERKQRKMNGEFLAVNLKK